jgi:hypothetical protein
MDYRISAFRGNVGPLWRWGNCVISIGRDPVTHWHNVITQKTAILSYSTARTPKLQVEVDVNRTFSLRPVWGPAVLMLWPWALVRMNNRDVSSSALCHDRVGRFLPFICQKALRESIYDLGTRRGWGVRVTSRPHLTPRKDPLAIVQEAGWASGPVWTGAENLAPTGIRSPDRPARRQSLYRQRYPAHPW